MYIQVKNVNYIPVWAPSFREAYRILRERNFFSVLAAIRYAYWLAYGNKMMPPGELASWFRRQYAEHPRAFGLVLVLWAYAIIIFIAWTITR